MKKFFTKMKKAIKKRNPPEVKLKFTTCGEVLIDGLPFKFAIESDGIASQKGFVVAISGEPVNNGELTFDVIDAVVKKNNKSRKITRKLDFITKKDGKRIYQVRFTDIAIADSGKSGVKAGLITEENFLDSLSRNISFAITPHYKLENDQEVMITIYPLENILTGSVVKWLDCTSDENYFLRKPLTDQKNKIRG